MPSIVLGMPWASNKHPSMNKGTFLSLATVFWAPPPHPLAPHRPHPHHCSDRGYAECTSLGWALLACSPSCRTQMPIHSRMSCNSGPGLARGCWHPCGTRLWLRFGPWTVSAKDRELFDNAVTKRAGHILASTVSQNIHTLVPGNAQNSQGVCRTCATYWQKLSA